MISSIQIVLFLSLYLIITILIIVSYRSQFIILLIEILSKREFLCRLQVITVLYYVARWKHQLLEALEKTQLGRVVETMMTRYLNFELIKKFKYDF